MIDIDKLVRTNVINMTPYSSARDEFSGTSEGMVFLDANENPFGTDHNRYPDPYQRKVKIALAALKGLEENQIFLGNGSDEVIDLLFRVFCNPGKDSIISLPPTYGMYKCAAQTNDVENIEVRLTADFQIDVEKTLAAVRPNKTKLIFVCSPNNPSANLMSKASIEALLNAFKGIVVVDEAYIDFCSADASTLSFLKEHNNLVVLNTFSKAWGLAGLRLGIAYADPSIIRYLTKIKPPYNVNSHTQQAALKVLSNLKDKDFKVREILNQRVVFTQEVKKYSYVKEIYHSDANFVLVKVDEAKQLYDFLLAHNIVVRDRSSVVLCEGTLRFTIGTAAEIRELLGVLLKFESSIKPKVE